MKRGDYPAKVDKLWESIAYGAAADKADKRMRAEGRNTWTREDYNLACVEYHRLRPCPEDVKCEICAKRRREIGR